MPLGSVPLAPGQGQKCELQSHFPHTFCGVYSHRSLLRPAGFSGVGQGESIRPISLMKKLRLDVR